MSEKNSITPPDALMVAVARRAESRLLDLVIERSLKAKPEPFEPDQWSTTEDAAKAQSYDRGWWDCLDSVEFVMDDIRGSDGPYGVAKAIYDLAEFGTWLADRAGVSFDDCEPDEQEKWLWEAETVMFKLGVR